jgi:hypothetical protein
MYVSNVLPWHKTFLRCAKFPALVQMNVPTHAPEKVSERNRPKAGHPYAANFFAQFLNASKI